MRMSTSFLDPILCHEYRCRFFAEKLDISMTLIERRLVQAVLRHYNRVAQLETALGLLKNIDILEFWCRDVVVAVHITNHP